MCMTRGFLTYLSKNFLGQSFLSLLLPWSTPNAISQKQSSFFVGKIVATFLEDLEYCPPGSSTDSEIRTILSKSLRLEYDAYRSLNNYAWFDTICLQASAMAELCFSGHTAEVQLQIARFTWFMLYLDDLCHKFPASVETLQRSVFTKTSSEEPVLQCFHSHLSNMYHFWDSIPANCITLSAMEYLNGCALEEMPAIQNMKISISSQSWPYYLRAKTGVAAAYAFMIFPRDSHPDVSAYIQVIGDITLFIDLTNDVLSFHKESLAGETNNYVHNRAHTSRKSVQDTLHDVARDALAAHARVTKTLQNTGEGISWQRFVNGYLAFHVTQARYRLNDLGF